MLTCSYLVLWVVTVSITSVYADGDCGPATTHDLDVLFLECAKEHGVTDAEIQTATELEDASYVKPCFWACCFKKSGFLDDNGRYVLYPGLNYVRKIVKRDDAYTDLEIIARQCESVNDQAVKYEEAGCERGALVAACFMEQMDQIRFFN